MRIKNWKKFQHFKNRRPPWIKLYRDILDDLDWHKLPAESAKTLIMLWLIASEGEDGTLPNIKTLSFRLRMNEKRLSDCISTLSGWLYQDDITVISKRYQDDPSETERETEEEREAEKELTLLSTSLNGATVDPPHPSPSAFNGTETTENGHNNGNGAFKGLLADEPTPDKLAGLWNDEAHSNLPRVEILTDARKRSAQARLNEYPSVGFWRDLIQRINDSRFLRGDSFTRNGDKPFRCTFDWILSPGNIAKIVEGNYDNAKSKS